MLQLGVVARDAEDFIALLTNFPVGTRLTHPGTEGGLDIGRCNKLRGGEAAVMRSILPAFVALLLLSPAVGLGGPVRYPEPPCDPAPCGPGGSGCTFYQCPQTYTSSLQTSTWCSSENAYIGCDYDVCYYSQGLNSACCTYTSICCVPDENGRGQKQQTSGTDGPCN